MVDLKPSIVDFMVDSMGSHALCGAMVDFMGSHPPQGTNYKTE